jgi:serine/threonine protein kinase
MTGDLNLKGRISPSFKALLSKMLAFNPCDRQSLAEIAATDAWFNKQNQMSLAEYVFTMDSIHTKIS